MLYYNTDFDILCTPHSFPLFNKIIFFCIIPLLGFILVIVMIQFDPYSWIKTACISLLRIVKSCTKCKNNWASAASPY